MPYADFTWLLKQAQNIQTKQLLKELQIKSDLVRKTQKKYSGNKFFELALGKYKIWLKEFSAPTSIIFYDEIFHAHEHTKHPKFKAQQAKYIIDGGANEGFYSLYLHSLNPQAKIIAIEPSPYTLACLRKNISGNKIKNIKIAPAMLGAKNGKADLEIFKQVSAISSCNLKKLKRAWLDYKQIKKISVPVLTLESIIKKYHYPYVDLLKLDIEGAEYATLKSGKKILPLIKKIVVEYHGLALKTQVCNFLEKNNFQLVQEAKGKGLIFEEQRGNICGDLYFVNKNYA